MEEPMFGFMIGALFVTGLFAFKRHRRRMLGGFYCGPQLACGGMGAGPWGGPFSGYWGSHGGRHRAPFRRRGRVLDPLFRELDASPGQERVMAELAEKLRSAFSGAHGAAGDLRRELAALFDAPTLDEARLADVVTRGQTLVQGLGDELRTALAALHGSLDPEQRRVLAQLLARQRY
jgi:Spy/CpxP family protein refolding chaperone